MTAHQRTQFNRIARLAAFAILAQLPVVLAQPTLTWRNIVSLFIVPVLEATWRQMAPATPDVLTPGGSSQTISINDGVTTSTTAMNLSIDG